MKFELVTPDKLLASEDKVQYVHCAGVDGDFGVLPGHMPLIATLRENAPLTVTKADGKTETFTVVSGFAEVTAKSVTIIAEQVD